mmetsp:Transcript_22336/g.46436  ORF Transcript_22336/g.46436 Transcript_22336/m.46436 type:complete len:705 (-) Transcript_22336:13-2127(-)
MNIVGTTKKLTTLQNLLSSPSAQLTSLITPLKKLQSDAMSLCHMLSTNRKQYTFTDYDQTSFSSPRDYFHWVSDLVMRALLCTLLQTNGFQEVIQAVDGYNEGGGTPENSPPGCFDNFKAYALYRLKKFSEAIKVSKSALSSLHPDFRYSNLSSVHHKHIISQSHYRLQDYGSSMEAYEGILQESDDEDPEVMTNMLAGLISSESYDLSSLSNYTSLSPTLSDYDYDYNLATALAAVGEYTSAAEVLMSAESGCREAVQGGKEEFEREAGIIRAQQAYVLLGMGDAHASKEVYEDLERGIAVKGDSALNFAVVNNLAASSVKGENAGEHVGRLEKAYRDAKDRLNSVQARQAEENINVLKLLSSSPSTLPTDGDLPKDDVLRQTAIKVALSPSTSQDIVKSKISSTSSPEEKTSLNLMLAQLHIDDGEIQEAIDVLESLHELRYKPAVIKTRADLYSQLKSPKADTLFEETLSGTDIDPHSASSLKISRGEYLLACGNYESAAKIFKDTLDVDGGGMSEEEKVVIIALLVQAYSHFDVDSAEQYVNELPAPSSLQQSETLDGEELEFMELPRPTQTSRATSQLLVVNTDMERNERRMKNRALTMMKREKRKKEHLEKLMAVGKYNPDNPWKPDPERWLPKNQRSYNKKGKKNRDKFSGAQGAGGGGLKDAAKLDAAARAAGGDSDARAFSTAHLAVGGKKNRRR